MPPFYGIKQQAVGHVCKAGAPGGSPSLRLCDGGTEHRITKHMRMHGLRHVPCVLITSDLLLRCICVSSAVYVCLSMSNRLAARQHELNASKQMHICSLL